jgi:predicted RNase H-like HicB family nuclease
VLTEYINAAMRHARYEILPESGGYYGEIPELPGVWANADTLEACREELREVLEDWIALGLAQGSPIPSIDGFAITVKQPA